MINWLKSTAERQKELLGLASNKTGLPAYAIEKDWWVTLALYAIFRTPWSDHLVFKGGTSLSKSWDLIERFSEDIDLVIDRSVLGFGEELSNSKIKELRKASCAFISGEFRDGLEKELLDLGIPADLFSLKVAETTESDRDPQVLELYYESVLEKGSYLKEAVLIEIGARSLKEPSEQREISPIISQALGDFNIAGEPFSVLTVLPARTFLEKVFLLHEEFCKPAEKIRTERMSRHLYDLDRIMDTEHGKQALEDKDLYKVIVEHRAKFNVIRGIGYEKHGYQDISFIPPVEVLGAWENDYKAMQESMIYGDSKTFKKLVGRMEELTKRFRDVK
ncbi:nucleotidyltransferase AbiEii toxin of type IV toxin-antitoxin system [Pedobacter psychrotolerans]|uniref:Nucleotidyltransferase n=1 Tax=Pedobacter psychrotolerans TaxID=1843235 RepID=A0A4R2HFY8_9SPHI|nr:nucleotidyl transferase AbiEii/AbiGii toxin family protein [Pedobacter psychrotolerans]TCO27065.1 nucleotidyltransferase AbiEii toxin of type IV toxin-antitoxin system [Pedobacter psychrotolerans]GGE58636.1 nucleotidyltransferase [Pedobacter psychrotolerans]